MTIATATTATRTAAYYTVSHGNCATFHPTLDEAMQVYNRGGCRFVTANYTDWTTERVA
jgi:hypothetical protein